MCDKTHRGNPEFDIRSSMSEGVSVSLELGPKSKSAKFGFGYRGVLVVLAHIGPLFLALGASDVESALTKL